MRIEVSALFLFYADWFFKYACCLIGLGSLKCFRGFLLSLFVYYFFPGSLPLSSQYTSYILFPFLIVSLDYFVVSVCSLLSYVVTLFTLYMIVICSMNFLMCS